MSHERLAQIEDQIKKLTTGSKWLGRREIKELPNILRADEDVLDLIQGHYENRQGLLVCTQSRLIFVDKGMLGGLKVEDFALDKVTSIQFATGLLLGSVTIHASGNKAEIRNVEKAAVKPFADGVRMRIDMKSASAEQTPKENSTTLGGGGLTQELERLGALRTQGLLSEDEFASAKKKLLGI